MAAGLPAAGLILAPSCHLVTQWEGRTGWDSWKHSETKRDTWREIHRKRGSFRQKEMEADNGGRGRMGDTEKERGTGERLEQRGRKRWPETT